MPRWNKEKNSRILEVEEERTREETAEKGHGAIESCDLRCSHEVGIKSANSICGKKPRVEGHPGDNTVLGDIEFVPNDASIVDLRMGMPNEVLGCFGVSISIWAERPKLREFNARKLI
ncbi:unnamed protein product [Ilex paraguariensis]|uniref:Uncharacterized protein n=1 Tax=Ilex paraguariensis TaxID=185542 RepID=A0ABC8QTJ8_9AQUA